MALKDRTTHLTDARMEPSMVDTGRITIPGPFKGRTELTAGHRCREIKMSRFVLTVLVSLMMVLPTTVLANRLDDLVGTARRDFNNAANPVQPRKEPKPALNYNPPSMGFRSSTRPDSYSVPTPLAIPPRSAPNSISPIFNNSARQF